MSSKVTFEAEIHKAAWKPECDARYSLFIAGTWMHAGVSELVDSRSPILHAVKLKPGYKQRVRITVEPIGEPVKGDAI